MLLALQAAAAALPGFVRLGRFQLPVFGLIATAGLVAALALSQRTARLAGLDPNRLWDAGIVGIVSAFLASRLLLIAVNLRLFLAHPFLVFAQPSLTVGGLVLTATLVALWLRRRHLPLRRVLDAWAAPAALLAAILQLGHWIEGTDAGMPTTLPWSIPAPAGLAFARVHPVQLYAAAGYLALCLLLWHLLQGNAGLPAVVQNARCRQTAGEEVASSGHGFSRAVTAPAPSTAFAAEGSPSGPTSSHVPGRIASIGLLTGGLLSFSLSFLRQPYDPVGTAWLDPTQWTALLAILLGSGMWAFSPTGHPATPSPERAVKG